MIIQDNMEDLNAQVHQEEEEDVDEEDNQCQYNNTYVDQLEVLQWDPINQRQMILNNINCECSPIYMLDWGR